MKAKIESTEKIIEFNGVPARVWEGETEGGIKCHFYVTRVAIAADETRTEEFEQELSKQKAPSPEVQAIPLRMIL